MTTSQFFVYKRSVAWCALVATLVWGIVAYQRMPQRQDPVIPVRNGVVVTAYPGAKAEKVEQEVTRKIERKVSENPSVEHVYSLSRQGLSIVFVDLFETEKNAELVWQDIANKLASISDLPRVNDEPLTPRLDKDYGDTVAVMLTLSSPPVTDLEVELRARNITETLARARAECKPEFRENRVSGVLVYPSTLAREIVLRIGRTLLQRFTEAGVIRDGRIIEAPSTGCIDFQLLANPEVLVRAFEQWELEHMATGELPPDVWEAFIVRDLAEIPAHLRRCARDKYTYRELREFADRIQDRLKQFPTIGKVEQIGVQEEQITLSYSGQRFNQFGIRPAQVIERLQQRNINMPGGNMELKDQNVVVHPTGAFKNEQEIGQVIISVSEAGYPLYMRDLGEITRGYVDPPRTMNFRTVKVPVSKISAHKANHAHDQYELQTTRAITLSIRQVRGSHIADFGRDVDAALASLEGVLPDDLRLERTSNEPAEVREKIGHFMKNFYEAIAIVILVALLFMEWRSAILVATSIPLTVAMTLGICQLIGIDLQQVSIAALIIALGLLVDDPVVAADAINRELADGQKPDVAAWLGPQKLARAILYATLTNCVAFLPLLIIGGGTGDFIYSLPVVVTASLVCSRIVSMTFMPLLGYYVLKGQRGFEASGAGGRRSRFAQWFRDFTFWSLDHKWKILGASLLVLIICVVILGLFMKTAFFPKDLHETFTVNVYMPEGSPIRQTRDETFKIIKTIDDLEGKHIASYTTFVGAGGPRFWLSIVPEQEADNYAQILVHTRDKHITTEVVRRLKLSLPKKIDAARVTIEELETGPPIGIPVQLRLFGPEIESLRQLAAGVKEQLKAIPGTDNIHDDWDPEVLQISLDIQAERANLTNISHADVAAVVHTGLSGNPVTQLREKDRLIDVVLRLRSDERSQVNDLRSINVMSASGETRVPLAQIARLKTEMVAPKIWRRDHERCLTVKCDTVSGILPSQVVEQLQERLQNIFWPAGYRYEFAGEHKEQAKGFADVKLALLTSLAAIYLALVLQFNSLVKPLIVYAAVPFGMVGGVMGLILFDAPFGFMAFLGVASLAGVIVSHIIVLFEFIEEMREKGEPLHEALADATLVRLRPVLVTVLATVGGLIPLALEGGPLWQPMCYVQIVGLLIATVVTKVIVPAIYVMFVENLRIIKWEREEHAKVLSQGGIQ